jgi:crotonobetainyl-CoA:carnitine CoA-transferase CaiB-like acyl-CoA transferase
MAQFGSLQPYRILDLTTHRGWFASRLLADLGATVIKVEPPGGDPGRMLGPFADDVPDPEGALQWWAYNRGKCSVTLDLEAAKDRELLLKLAAKADAVVESFNPGQMEAWDIGLERLLAANARMVLTRITPFGQTGPYAGFAASDLILSAAGGAAWLAGDEDRAPVRVTAPQYFLHASAEAALHTAVALFHAASTGEGQQIDVSAQAATVRTLLDGFTHAYTGGRLLRREKLGEPSVYSPFRSLFRCADGAVIAAVGSGAGLGGLRAWAQEDGEQIPDQFEAISRADLTVRGGIFISRPPELVTLIAAWLDGFFAKRTRAVLVAEGMKRGLLISAINTLADILKDEQLAARSYYQPVRHAGRETAVRYPSVWAHLSRTPLLETRAAPRIGEHNEQVWDEARLGNQAFEAHAPRGDDLSETRTGDVFAGLKVWDISWVGVGPLTTRYLGDYGATVVRTESARSLDVLRRVGPFKDGVPGINRSQFFAEFNASKLGVGVNFATPEGQEVGLRLAAWADVVVESFSPGAMERLGLGYDALKAVNPSIVMLSTSMNGQTGPRRNFSGFGNGLAAMAGFVDLTGWPDRSPNTPYGAYTDFVAQRFCGTALVAALDYRRRTGEGQYIDVSQYEVSTQLLAPFLLDAEINGRILTRSGNRDHNASPHGIFRCRDENGLDRWVAIAVETETEWSAFVRCIGAPAWTSAPKFAKFAGRKANEDELESLVGAWTADKTAAEIFEQLQPEVPVAPVRTNNELLEDPQLLHRGYLRTLHHAEVGDMPYEGSQAIASATPAYPRKAAPVFGTDTVQVLRDFLGYEPDEIKALIALGAVELQGPSK